MGVRLFRRRLSRREILSRRANDLIGRGCWTATRWYGRQLRAALPNIPGKRGTR